MKVLTLTMLTLVMAQMAVAERTVLEIAWPEGLPAGVTREADGSLRVSSSSDEGLTVTLVEVEAPPITTDRYAVRGRLRYRDVSGKAYLEMWSVFAEGRYFTRTNLDSGPLAGITGSSEGRDVLLPFDATGASAAPEKLILNVVMPGPGEITIAPLVLVELEPGEVSGGAGGARAGLWGGLAGAVLGVFGGLLGWLGGKGKARGFVLTGFRTMMALGAVSLVLGLVSLARGAEYAVYYPLLLIGVIAVIVPASILPRVRKRYEELELGRMSALDA